MTKQEQINEIKQQLLDIPGARDAGFPPDEPAWLIVYSTGIEVWYRRASYGRPGMEVNVNYASNGSTTGVLETLEKLRINVQVAELAAALENLVAE